MAGEKPVPLRRVGRNDGASPIAFGVGEFFEPVEHPGAAHVTVAQIQFGRRLHRLAFVAGRQRSDGPLVPSQTVDQPAFVAGQVAEIAVAPAEAGRVAEDAGESPDQLPVDFTRRKVFRPRLLVFAERRD